jgi:hypothetical protein
MLARQSLARSRAARARASATAARFAPAAAFVRHRSSVPVDKSKPTPTFGKQVAPDDTSQAQLMHDISRGKFEYIGDFMASLNRGPVKLDYGKDAKPISEKERLQDELNERNLKMIQRSLLLGSLAAAGGCFLGWQLTKLYYGVRNITEFNEVMRERMPKVSGSMEDSLIGRKLKEEALQSRDAISENPELANWRRSLRGKFNTEEGAKLARQNSITLAQKREEERAARALGKTPSGSAMPLGGPALISALRDDADALAALSAEMSAEMSGAMSGAPAASASATAAEGAEAEPPPSVRKLARTTSKVFQDVEEGVKRGGSSVVDTGVQLVRTTSRVLNTSAKKLKTYVSQMASEDTPSTAPAAEPKAR